MTDSSPSTPAVAAKNSAPEKTKKTVKKPPKAERALFASEAITTDIVDDVSEKARMRRVLRVVQMQAIVIVMMAIFFVMGAPFFQTIYQYYAIDSSDTNRHTTRLLALTMPNMTNRAILSWATNSITEIMTFGFGDFLPHLRGQQNRFTPEGWESFVNAFDRMKLGQTFRERQLVLTTVPSDTAVIVKQGPNLEHIYEWKVQMPVVMTYATNDNMTHRDRAIIELTISRVAPSDNPNGIAIKTWSLGR